MQEQKQTAMILYEQMCMASRIAALEDVSYYVRLMEQADMLLRYFARMSENVKNMSEELEQLSMKISDLLKECRQNQKWELYDRK